MADAIDPTSPPPGRKRRTLRRLLAALVGLLGLGAAGMLGFRAWVHAAPDPDAPRVVLSIGADWANDVGLHQAAYQASLTRLGARTVEVSPRDERSASEILAEADALVLTGGGDVDPRCYGGDPSAAVLVDAKRDAFEMALLREALARDLPVLAVCRGHQLLNVHLGGTLRDLRQDRELSRTHGISARSLVAHDVVVRPGSCLAGLWQGAREGEVNSFHGQAIGSVASGLVVSARAADGVVEAVEVPDRRFVLGVQWHPEMMTTPQARAIFSGLLEEARAQRRERAQRRAPALRAR